MQKRCAEVLVPERVDASMIRYAYVPDAAAARELDEVVGSGRLEVRVDEYLFFRGPKR
jgi:hypothetical protein